MALELGDDSMGGVDFAQWWDPTTTEQIHMDWLREIQIALDP